jgi:hypothetical protein
LLRRYFVPRPAIRAAVEAFQAQQLGGASYVAAHVRGSDKVAECSRLADVNRRYFRRVDALLNGNADRLFLMTDSAAIVREYTARYGSRVVFTDAERTETEVGVHYAGSHDPVRLGTEVVVDVYVAAGARAFVGNGTSNPSCVIAFLREWAPGGCTLVGENNLRGRVSLHRRGQPAPGA